MTWRDGAPEALSPPLSDICSSLSFTPDARCFFFPRSSFPHIRLGDSAWRTQTGVPRVREPPEPPQQDAGARRDSKPAAAVSSRSPHCGVICTAALCPSKAGVSVRRSLALVLVHSRCGSAT